MTSDPLERYISQRGFRTSVSSWLRPLTMVEILDASLDAYRLLGWSIIRLAAWPALATLAALVFAFELVLPNLAFTSSPSSVPVQISEAKTAFAIVLFVAVPLMLAAMGYAVAAIGSAVSDHLIGLVPSLAKAQSAGRKNVWRFVGLGGIQFVESFSLTIVGALALAGGFALLTEDRLTDLSLILFISGGLFLSFGLFLVPFLLARTALAIPAMAVEDLGIRQSLRRGSDLSKSRPRQGSGYSGAVVLLTVWGFLYLAILAGLYGVFGLMGVMPFLQSVLGPGPVGMVVLKGAGYLPLLLATWMVIPVWCASTTIHYFERRVRLEGFDIDALAKSVWSSDRNNRFEL